MINRSYIGRRVFVLSLDRFDIPDEKRGKTAIIVDVIEDDDFPEDTDVYIRFDGDEEDDVWWILPEGIKLIGNILNL